MVFSDFAGSRFESSVQDLLVLMFSETNAARQGQSQRVFSLNEASGEDFKRRVREREKVREVVSKVILMRADREDKWRPHYLTSATERKRERLERRGEPAER